MMFRRLLDWMVGRREPDGGRVTEQERRVEKLTRELEDAARRRRLELEVASMRRRR